jgi:hypothetical protein
VARDLAERYRRAPWRFAVLDDKGYLLLAGATRRRPTTPELALRPVEGGVVELHVAAEQLAALAHDPTTHPEWVGVVADIAAQFADRRRLVAALGAHPASRHARGRLLRHIQVRDRTCIAPGCRRAARRCDADHTQPYAAGGGTTTGNVGPLCPRHHALKHHGGWQLRQPRPGHFRWRSPLGEQYATRGEPIMPPLPEPCPGPLPSQLPTTGPTEPRYVDGPSYHTSARLPRLAPDTPPPRHSFWKRPPPEDPEHPAPF